MIETAEKTGIQGRIINVSSVIHSWVKRDGFCFNDILNGKKYKYLPLFFFFDTKYLPLCKSINNSNCIKFKYLYHCISLSGNNIAAIMEHVLMLSQNWQTFCMPRK